MTISNIHQSACLGRKYNANEEYFSYIKTRKDHDDVGFVLDNHAELDFFHSTSLVKQTSTSLQPIRHIIRTSSWQLIDTIGITRRVVSGTAD